MILRAAHSLLFILLVSGCALPLYAAVAAKKHCTSSIGATNVAVLDFSGDDLAPILMDELSRALAVRVEGVSDVWRLLEADLARAAARGMGYAGSLNMTLEEARDLGRSIGCDFYFVGRAELLRRSPAANSVHHEAYAAIFLVSARTGRLVHFDFLLAEAAAAPEARRQLLGKLTAAATRYRAVALRARAEEERDARARDSAAGAEVALIEEADDALSAKQELRLPQPYRRVRPPYTEQASRAAIEATVDVAVVINTSGEVSDIEVRRWAGFGLDEVVTAVVREMHFRPAMRMRTNEVVPLRVLLRYNFRRPEPSR